MDTGSLVFWVLGPWKGAGVVSKYRLPLSWFAVRPGVCPGPQEAVLPPYEMRVRETALETAQVIRSRGSGSREKDLVVRHPGCACGVPRCGY